MVVEATSDPPTYTGLVLVDRAMTCNRFTRLVLATRASAVPAVVTSFCPDKSTGPSLIAIPMTGPRPPPSAPLGAVHGLLGKVFRHLGSDLFRHLGSDLFRHLGSDLFGHLGSDLFGHLGSDLFGLGFRRRQHRLHLAGVGLADLLGYGVGHVP